MSTPITPTFSSLALLEMPRPDFVEVMAVPLPPGSSSDPAWWARAIFGGPPPAAVGALMRLRQAIVPLLGLRPSPPDTFAVRQVVGQEALMVAHEAHLDFRCAVGVDPTSRLLRVTTVVRLHGWRGRVYFAPVRLLHPSIERAMIRAALRRSRTARPEGSAASSPSGSPEPPAVSAASGGSTTSGASGAGDRGPAAVSDSR